MKEIKLNGLDQSVFFEKLKNGLQVFFIPYENKTNYAMHYVTKFGSINTTFSPIGEKKMITVPDGIAHFLEHKMFEQEDGMDPFTFASKSGTNSNASTSYKITRYYFEGSNNFLENLDYLLTYVHSPYFTDENVEKEKGIIAEEIKQYDDEIDWILDEELRKSLFHKDPTRIDIAGTVESISKITKELLYKTYNTFYQPSNMILLVSGCFNKEDALEVIQKNEALNNAETNQSIKEKKEEEPTSVLRTEYSFTFPIVNSKVAFGIKIPVKSVKDRYRFNLYVGMILNILFGLSSKFRERMKSEKLMTSFYNERDFVGDYLVINFYADSKDAKRLIKEIKNELKHGKIMEEEIERLKKVWISSEVVMVDNISLTLDNLLDDIINYGKIIENKIDLYKSMNKKELDEVYRKIDFENASVVYVEPKES
ncbi:MAG: insulinase family protein [Bacilli bacterium]|nr:insulinase family protein [Bacilli bacterium]